MSDYILEDNLVQILKYSPVKTLLRFRSVCKKWKEMIDSSFFIKEHLAVQKPRFIAEYNDERDFLIIDPQIQPLVTTIRDPIEDPTVLFFLFGTLHGVICLFDYCNTLHLWNPSVGKLSTLPLPGYKYLEFSYSGDITQTCYAFWISPSTKEFKVLFFDFYWEDNDERVLDGILYSSIRHDWREIPVGEIWNSCQNGPPLIIGDMAYWRGHYDYVNEQGDVCKAMVILSFDFGKEAFEFIEMPEVKFLRRARHIPYRLQGLLSVMCWDEKFPHRSDFFVRQQGKWRHMFRSNLVSPIADVLWVLADMNDRLRILAATQLINRELVLYDTKLGCIPLIGSFSYAYVAYDFVESLVFPKFVNPEKGLVVQSSKLTLS